MKPRRLKRTRDQELICDAFIAFDGRSVGASHREVAEVIYGVKDVRDQWSARGGRMKERMHRALAKVKGCAMVDTGGWSNGRVVQILTVA